VRAKRVVQIRHQGGRHTPDWFADALEAHGAHLFALCLRVGAQATLLCRLHPGTQRVEARVATIVEHRPALPKYVDAQLLNEAATSGEALTE
jgi:hypothetical protein